MTRASFITAKSYPRATVDDAITAAFIETRWESCFAYFMKILKLYLIFKTIIAIHS